MVTQRKSHCGDALQGPFGRGTHCAGIEGVDTRIVAVVDAGHHQVGRTSALGQQDIEGQFHTVDGTAGTSEDFQPFFAVHQTVVNGSGRSDGASIARTSAAGSDNEQVSHRMERVYQGIDARSFVAVIVGDKNVGTRHATVVRFCHKFIVVVLSHGVDCRVSSHKTIGAPISGVTALRGRLPPVKGRLQSN